MSAPHVDSRSRPDRRALLWAAFGVCALNLVVYAVVSSFDFVTWDDPPYVTDNPMVLAGLSWRGLWWAFTTTHGPYWHPLTWLSHMADVQIFGLHAGGHHVTSLIFHLANSVLVLLVLVQMTGAIGRSAFVAALFAVHPLHVESVAWVAERKDLLSTCLLLLTIAAYVRYVRRPTTRAYAGMLLLFALGLMAKPMIVTLPALLLLLDIWPLARPSRAIALIKEKLPMAVVGAIAALAAFLVQRRVGAVAGFQSVSLISRVANALMSYGVYLAKMCWPTRLAALYPYPQFLPPWWQLTGAAVFLGATTVFALRLRATRPYITTGWFWYVAALLPVIGLVQVGAQAMADRFTYVPLLGIFVIVAWGVPELVSRWRARRVALPIAAALAVAVFAVLSAVQVRTWASSATMWQHAIAVTDGNYHAESALGALLQQQGRLPEAMAHKTEALRINPDDPDANNEMGRLLESEGRLREAVPYFSRALTTNPEYAEAHHNIGVALVGSGDVAQGITHLSEAVRLNPDLAVTHNALGLALAQQGRVEDAFAEFQEAVQLEPEFAAAHYDLGGVYASRGETALAEAEFREAVRLDPRHANAHHNLGVALAAEGRVVDAIAEYREALQLEPDLADAHSNLSNAYDALGQPADALREGLEAVRLAPDRADVQYNAAVLTYRSGNVRAAVEHLDAALKLDPSNDGARRMLAAIAPTRRH